MYLLVTLSDVIQIHPAVFNKSSVRAIEDFVNEKYADKVIHKVGLCLGFFSIITATEGLIGHGTGIVNVNADFQVIVFRPFKGEILHGTIADSNPKNGIYMSTGFLEDINVPPQLLFENNTDWGTDDQGTSAFIWHSENAETNEVSDYYFDQAEGCLFRVEAEEWRDLSPQMQRPDQQYVETTEKEDDDELKTPYLLRGSMALSGLGPSIWWIGEEDPAAVEDGSE